MIRIRFHGRGGHGIKTASRIVGTAAFLNGWQAQDSPLFGAERRGAPLAAFTRIDREPVRERGIIANPTILMIVDESLLADPAAGVMQGHESASVLFVNTAAGAAELIERFRIKCPVRTADLTSAAIEVLGRGFALSAPVGAVACALVGSIPIECVEAAVRDELEDLSLPVEVIDKNVQLARQVFEDTSKSDGVAVEQIEFRSPAERNEFRSPALYRPVFQESAKAAPVIENPGNSYQRHTGSWRIFRPVIDMNACTRCQICLVRCPDGAITLDAEGYPVIDYDNCKGCMICRQECPIHCIEEQKEVRAW